MEFVHEYDYEYEYEHGFGISNEWGVMGIFRLGGSEMIIIRINATQLLEVN